MLRKCFFPTFFESFLPRQGLSSTLHESLKEIVSQVIVLFTGTGRGRRSYQGALNMSNGCSLKSPATIKTLRESIRRSNGEDWASQGGQFWGQTKKHRGSMRVIIQMSPRSFRVNPYNHLHKCLVLKKYLTIFEIVFHRCNLYVPTISQPS